MNAHEIKATIAGYFRYEKQCPIVCFEASEKLKWGYGGLSDILAVTASRMVYEVEVKVSLSDLKHDAEKRKHRTYSNRLETHVHKFYFAVPSDIASKAREICDFLFPYAGILRVNGLSYLSVVVSKEAKALSQKRIDLKALVYLVKEQSGTLCRLAKDKAEYQEELCRRRGEVAELRKALKLGGITL